MARDQEKFFESMGIDTKIVRGDNRFFEGSHAWVAVNINNHFIHIDSIGWYPMIPEWFLLIFQCMIHITSI